MKIEDIFVYPIAIIFALYAIPILFMDIALTRLCDYFLYGDNNE